MNSLQGAVDVPGRDGAPVFQMRVTVNAMCAFEDKTGEAFTDALAGADDNKLNFGKLRLLVHAICVDRALTEDQVGDLMDLAGLPVVAQCLAEAVRRAFPEAEAGNAQTPQETAAAN